ncbi:hypothetical protein BDZ91DRAFT_715866 [Kalaharituber pfeilii]|nr:hypothetical protein BDZ91DRAFT_715866 [Kalaharituber pfeilii]
MESSRATAGARTVAIIGAGPSGLTTAKACIEAGLRPHIFEAKHDVGGLWAVNAVREQSSNLTCPPNMRTNLSRWTCSFSDFAWREDHIENFEILKQSGQDDLPIFPLARDVQRYLESYAAKFIPAKDISLGTRVTNVSQVHDLKWRVGWEQSSVDSKEGFGVFDHLAICSGFFSTPYIPSIPGLEDFKKNGHVLHSSDHKRVVDDNAYKNGKQRIAIVGGSLSAVEVASDLALRKLEDESIEIIHIFPRPFWIFPRFLPTADTSGNSPQPSFLPLDLVLYDGIRRRKAQSAAAKECEGEAPSAADKNQQANQYMRAQTGNGNQASLSAALQIGLEEMRLPPYVVISDFYANFVRYGTVSLQRGYVTSIKPNKSTGVWNSLQISDKSPTSQILSGANPQHGHDPETVNAVNDIDMIIFATGYNPTTSFPSFFPQSLLRELSFEPSDNFLPFLLYKQMLHPSLITYSETQAEGSKDTPYVHAGFVGMYKGPYFGVLEGQARYLASLFAGVIQAPAKVDIEKGIAEQQIARQARNAGNWETRGQWSWGDYLGIVEDLQKVRAGKGGDSLLKGGIDRAIARAMSRAAGSNLASVIPAHFAPENDEDAQVAISSLDVTIEEAVTRSKFVARAVFRSLLGKWAVMRTFESRLKEMPSGTFVGVAKFLPRKPTFDINLPKEQDKVAELSCFLKKARLAGSVPQEGEGTGEGDCDITEYIYSEHGTFTLSTPPYFSFPAVRKYIYRYHPGTESISVWFVKPQPGYVPSATPPTHSEEMEAEVDYLFHEVEFVSTRGRKGECFAKGKEHLCEKDLYKANYSFSFGEKDGFGGWSGGAEVSEFTVGYDVHGPKKDYASSGRFERIRP